MTEPDAIDVGESGSAPLLGRERELRSLRAGLAEAARGHGSLFLITGEAGIGKTRLADAFADEARRSGATVAWGRSWEEGGAPAFWPWTQIVRSIMRDLGPSIEDALSSPQRAALARILPEIAVPADPLPTPSGDGSGDARFELFAAVTASLIAVTADRPLVVVLDDLHAADEPSLLLLRFAAAAVEDMPIVVLSIFRDDDVELGEVRTRLLGELARAPIMRPLQPRGLDQHDVALLVAGISANVSETVAATIHRETDGNPLFVAELARMLAEEDRLREVQPGHEWSGGVSAGVRAVIGRRLSRLSDDTRSLLARASVLGKEFPLEVVAGLEGAPAREVIRRFDPAVRSRILVRPAPGGAWRFGHALIREVLYTSIPMSERIALHLAAGEAIEHLHVDDRDHYLTELAHHFVEAAPLAGADRAIDHASRAAEGAMAAYAHEEAARLYRMALRVLEVAGGSEATRVRILLGLGRAESLSGRASAAKDAFRDAATSASSLGLDTELAQAAIGYGGRFFWSRAGDDIHLVPILVEALRRLPERDGVDRVRLLIRLSGALRDETYLDRREAISAEGLAMARRIGEPGLLAYAVIGRYAAIMGPDHADEMATLQRELAELEAKTDDVQIRTQGLWMSLMRFIEGGADRLDLRKFSESYDHLVEELRDPVLRWSLGMFRTILALLDGRLADAEALIDRTYAIGRGAQPWDAGFSALVATIALRREQDRLDEVVDAAREAVTRYPSYPLLSCVSAFVDASTGHADEARRTLAVMVGTGFATLPRDLGWPYGMIHLGEAAMAIGDRDAAAAVEAELAPFAVLHASASGEVSAGPVSLTLGRLAAFDGRIDEALAQFDTTERWITQMGAELWTIRYRVERAAVLLARDTDGDRATANALLEGSRSQCRALGLVALERRIDDVVAAAADQGRGDAAARVTERVEGSWRRDGEYWSISYGSSGFRLRHSKGIAYLATLLASPGHEFHALELAMRAGGVPSSEPVSLRAAIDAGLRADVGGGHPALDQPAIAAYRERIEDLQEEVDEAERFADRERAARARDELEMLVAELGRGLGLGGRARALVDDAERARQSVTKAIHAVQRRIREHDPALAAHLDRSVRTGTFCAYDPDPALGITWDVASDTVRV
jgi:hypothetical protein